MKRISLHSLCLVSLTVILVGFSAGQVATGTPAFSSTGGGPFDVVNLGNLNVHLTVPILHKAGRGMPFSADLAYDGSIWTPTSVGGVMTWMPSATFGWITQTQVEWGYLNVGVYNGSAPCYPPSNMNPNNFTVYSQWTYVDRQGVIHSFGNIQTVVGNTGCSTTPVPPSVSGVAAIDGSGYVLNANGASATVTTRDGRVLTVPINTTSGTASAQDANGNEITINSSGQFVDTLGKVAPNNVMTWTGSGTPASPTTFTYPSPGGSGIYTMNYGPYNVMTNFPCGIAQYNQTGKSLLNNITLPDGTQYIFTYEATPGYTGYVTARLATVTLPTGGIVSYQYTGSNNGIVCSDGSAAGLTRTLKTGPTDPGVIWTYTRSLISGNQWQTSVTTPPDPQNSGSASDNTIIQFQKDSATVSTNNFYETQRQTYQGAVSTPNLLQTTVTCYNTHTSNCTTTAVSSPITQVAATLQYPNSGKQSETVTSCNGIGLVTSINQYAYGTPSPGALIQNTQITYASLSNGIADHPASVLVYDGSSNLKSKTTYTYDEYSTYPLQTTVGTPNHISVTGSRGNPTTVKNYTTSTAALAQHFSYFDTGTVYKSYDVNGAVTTYNYPDATSTCGNSFPTSVTLPVTSLSTSTTWNCFGGVATQTTDVNGQPTNMTYSDPYFWRPAAVQDPALNTTAFNYTPTTTESLMAFNSSNSVAEQLATIDGLGRAILNQRQQGFNASNYDSTQTNYDALGRPVQVTMPYSGTKGQTTSTAPVMTTAYDALRRPLKTTDAGTGYVSYTYTQNDVLQATGPAPSLPVQENLKQKQLEYDSLGRLVSVCEITTVSPSGACSQSNSANGYLTTYSYSSNNTNNQVVVTQNAQSSPTQTRTYLYDLSGRLVSETNPETGTTTYTFDSASGCSGTYTGDLVKRVDAKGNSTCHAYDGLHRLTSVSYSGPYSTPTKNFIYDAATVNGVAMANAKGHLAEAYTGTSGSKITDLGLVYSVRGEVTEIWESTPNSGGYYHPTAAYWANGGLETLWMSGLPSISYGADGEGRTSAVSASSGQNPVTSAAYATSGTTQPIGALTQVTYGSGDSDTFTYDTNTGRMTQFKYTVSSQSEIGNLGWNPNNSLGSLGLTDPFNSPDTQSCAYSHDDLSRMQSANCGSTWGESYSYDPFGNINKSVISGSTGYSWLPTYTNGSTNTNRYFLIPGFTPTYDANGNLLTDSFHTYTWDAEGKMLSLDSTTLTYDALGRMVEQNQSGTYYQIVYTPMGHKLAVMKAQVIQQAFVPLPGSATAEYLSWGLSHYQHPDWLGSSRLESSTTHTIVQDAAYDSFGVPYAEISGGNGEISFTGQNKDTAWLEYDFLYRQYDPQQGRWISPDPAGLIAVDPTSPQSWNRYAYVGNNPTSAVDSVGLCDAVFGGITQSSTDAATQAETEFANSIGANLSFPYANGTVPGGILDVAGQGLTPNDSTMAAYATIMNSAAQTPAGQSFNVFTFSGGAQAFNSALSLVSSDVRSRIGNIVYVSPGNVSTLVSGNTSTTVIANPFGPIDNAIGVGSTGNATLLWTDCSHKANCTFEQFGQFLKSKAGSSCPRATTISRGNGGSGGGGGGYAMGAVGLPAWYGAMMGFADWVGSIGAGPIESVTHMIDY